MSDVVVGIDLGTTNTCVACYQNGQVQILENKEGGRTTPSFIFVTERDKIIVGYYAKKMAEAKPEYAISNIKRLIGRKYDDPCVKDSMQNIENDNNLPLIVVERRYKDNITFTPTELCSAILKKIKAYAEAKLGLSIDKAVITVPAYFNVNQREATLLAANDAGFTVLKLMNEPTAAALSYYKKAAAVNEDTSDKYILVYDLGGGTFDVAILKKRGNNIDVVGVGGDSNLGGCDLDNAIIEYVCKNSKEDPRKNRKVMVKLKKKCERAKKILSVCESESTTIFYKRVLKDPLELTRVEFERMADEIFKRTIKIMENCIESCNLIKSDIKVVIMSGGSTRIPKIQEMISSYFGEKIINEIVNPDECVAEGAALQAAMLSKSPNQKIDVFRIKDVIPLSLGIKDAVNRMEFFIRSNTSIPFSATRKWLTMHDKQEFLTVDVYEGERTDAKKNRHIATFQLNDLTPAPPGQCVIDVTFAIDENGILKVTAKEQLKDNMKELTITYTRGNRSDSEVQNALKDAQRNKKNDENFLMFAQLKEYVLHYCTAIKFNLNEKNLKENYEDIFEWCDSTYSKVDELEMNEIRKVLYIRYEMKNKCSKIVSKHNFEFMPDLELDRGTSTVVKGEMTVL